MNRLLFYWITVMAFVGINVVACTSHDEDKNGENESPEPQDTRVVMTASIGEKQDDTRTSIDEPDSDPKKGERFLWTANDKIGIVLEKMATLGVYSKFENFDIVAPVGDGAVYTGTADFVSTSSSINTDWSDYFSNACNVYAFYPAPIVQSTSDLATVNVTYNILAEQTQVGNVYTHLGINDPMWARSSKAFTPESGAVVALPGLQFSHLAALLRFRVTNKMGVDLGITKVIVKALGGVKPFKMGDMTVNLAATGNPALVGGEMYTDSLILNIKNDNNTADFIIPAGTTASPGVWNGYMTAVPVDLKGVLLDFIVVTKGGAKYSSLSNLDIQKELVAGKRYFFDLELAVEEDGVAGVDYTVITDGTWEIHTAKGFKTFADRINEGVDRKLKLNGKLTQEINLIGEWTPIGNTKGLYIGTFDGGNFAINGLVINTIVDKQGLFGCIGNDNNEGCVKNVILNNPNVKGGGSVGALVGTNVGATITRCHVIGGTVTGTTLGGIWLGNNIGGLVGYYRTGTINACSASASVKGENENVGGLVGFAFDMITACCATGAVEGKNNVGGLVGKCEGGAITGCYATGVVNATEIKAVKGGLMGYCKGVLSYCATINDLGSTTGNKGIKVSDIGKIYTVFSDWKLRDKYWNSPVDANSAPTLK